MRDESWRTLLELKESGLSRSVGVSNYGVGHMTEIITKWPREQWPSINQVGHLLRY